MAEGHTVLRWARMLEPLVGRPIRSVKLPSRYVEQAALFNGQSIDAIETRGKHLLFHCSNNLIIHCHAMMYGSWQIGKPGMPIRKEEKYVRLRFLTVDLEAVFFHGPVVELLRTRDLETHGSLSALGPDILNPRFDSDEVWERLRIETTREIGDLIIDQNVVSGIGNIYKSEGLYLASINPRQQASEIPRDRLDRIWKIIKPLMWRGAMSNGFITTIPRHLRKGDERNWVYRRRGRNCFRCGTKIEMIRQGPLKRSTYFCPNCQAIV